MYYIGSIGRLLGQRLGIPPAESTRHLFQRLSIALWRGNAALDLPYTHPITGGGWGHLTVYMFCFAVLFCSGLFRLLVLCMPSSVSL